MVEWLQLVSAFTAGLLGGVHCVGMCGGIVGALTLAMPRQQRRLPLLLGYNGGRILSYVVAGALFGGIGQLSALFVPLQQLQLLLALIAGVMMLLMGLYLGGWSGVLRHVEAAGGAIWKRIEPYGRRLLPVENSGQGFVLGLLWGWLPCGLVYSMLIWALGSGSAINGSLLLLAFGLGTLPNLLAAGLLAGEFVPFMQRPAVRSTAGAALILFGLYTLYRGFGSV
ncbi:MAG: sulfite exporter TauE/SafE family protein [Pseudomonadota bacterium]